MQEIGFVQLGATILTSGMLDFKVCPLSIYESEKNRVKKLLDARYDIEFLPIRSRKLVENLIKKGLYDWWRDSLFCAQIDSLRVEVLRFLRDEIEKHKIKIHRIGYQSVIVEGLTDHHFRAILRNVDNRFPGLICYYTSVGEQNITNPIKY